MKQEKGKWSYIRGILGRKDSRVWIPDKITFPEAKGLADDYAIMEGEFGYQCYLTAPLRIVNRQEPELRQLLVDLDVICCNDPMGRRLYYEQHKSGDNIDAGLGGGRILDGVWIHQQLVDFGLQDKIRAVLSGENSRLRITSEELAELRTRWMNHEERLKYEDF